MIEIASSREIGGYHGNNVLIEDIEQVMQSHDFKREALLEVLNFVQDNYGYLPEDALLYISNRLSLPLSHVYGVATFFSLFTFEPVGDIRCLICTDPACSIARAADVLEACQSYASSIQNGQITVESTTCLGLCDQAPSALVNREAFVKLKADSVKQFFAGEATRPRLQVTGSPRVITRQIGRIGPTDLDSHRQAGAFSALEKVLKTMTPGEVIDEIKRSGLAGRGGAGFPTGLKWQFTRDAVETPKYIICNFDESEPGTFKDRVLMEGDPFRVIEGIIISGYAVGANHGYIFIRGEYPEAEQLLLKAINRLFDAGLVGDRILNTSFNFDLTVRRSAGAYICGEETALFEAIEGNRGYPRTKPPFPTTDGLFGKPTAINNVETLALVPDIVLNGGAWLRQWGSEKSTGLKLFCLSGNVNQPGVVEAPFGITVRQLVEDFGGGFAGKPQAILMGGASGGLMPPKYFDTPITNEALDPLNLPVGSGVVMVLNQDVNLLDVLKTLAKFFVHETCGQCVPCRIGTRQVHKLLEKISLGNGTSDDIDRLHDLCVMMRDSSMCGLGLTAPNPILSSLEYFRDTYEDFIQEAS